MRAGVDGSEHHKCHLQIGQALRFFHDLAFMNSMKKQKDMTLKTPSGWWESGVLLEKSGEIAPERMKRLSQSGPAAQLWRCLVVQVKSDAVKNDIA